MSCECASEAAGCMPKPGLADLCCPPTNSCCEPDATLGDIPDTILAYWDENGQLPVPWPEGVEQPGDDEAEWVQLMTQATAALCVAHETIASRVCMARYAHTCCIKLTACIEVPCCCSCKCTPCKPNCDRESYRLNKICVPADRVKSVKIDGEDVLNSDGPTSVEYCDGSWHIYGDKCGTFDICFELAEPTALWTQAVLALACARIPCPHSKSCERDDDRDYYIALRERGYTGIDFVDDLETECCNQGGVTFGGGRRIERRVVWEACGNEPG